MRCPGPPSAPIKLRWWLSLTPITPLLFSPFIPLATAAAAATTCYTPSGNASTTLIPCNPGDPVSHCCSESDFCLSNGLCLNAGGNNGYSVQGCTDKSWGTPCDMRCPVSKVAYDGYIYLQSCSGLDGVDNPLCCGWDYTCCGVTANVITTIPLWQTLSRPGGIETKLPQSSSSSSATTGPSTSGTGTGDSTATTPKGDATPSETRTGAGGEQTGGGAGTDRTLAVGVGVGVPLGVALVAALGFLGWQVRKQRGVVKADKVQDSGYFASASTGVSPRAPWYYPQSSDVGFGGGSAGAGVGSVGVYEVPTPERAVEVHGDMMQELHGEDVRELKA